MKAQCPVSEMILTVEAMLRDRLPASWGGRGEAD